MPILALLRIETLALRLLETSLLTLWLVMVDTFTLDLFDFEVRWRRFYSLNGLRQSTLDMLVIFL